jgi:hypothetical protein
MTESRKAAGHRERAARGDLVAHDNERFGIASSLPLLAMTPKQPGGS